MKPGDTVFCIHDHDDTVNTVTEVVALIQGGTQAVVRTRNLPIAVPVASLHRLPVVEGKSAVDLVTVQGTVVKTQQPKAPARQISSALQERLNSFKKKP